MMAGLEIKEKETEIVERVQKSPRTDECMTALMAWMSVNSR
jgi:hypothetical protein